MTYAGYNVKYGLFREVDQFLAIEQRKNMNMIYTYFSEYGWKDNVIKAMITCFSLLSSCNPWYFEDPKITWNDLVIIATYQGGGGILNFAPYSQLYEFFLQNDLDPKNGDSHLFKIRYDYFNNLEWTPDASGLYYDWDSFRASDEKPEVLAPIFWGCYCHIIEYPARLIELARWVDENIDGKKLYLPTELAILGSNKYNILGSI